MSNTKQMAKKRQSAFVGKKNLEKLTFEDYYKQVDSKENQPKTPLKSNRKSGSKGKQDRGSEKIIKEGHSIFNMPDGRNSSNTPMENVGSFEMNLQQLAKMDGSKSESEKGMDPHYNAYQSG